MLEEPFTESHSVIIRLDPRVKIIAACSFSMVVAVSDRFLALITALLIALGVLFLARLPLKLVCSRLLIINSLIFLLWCFLPFTTRGQPSFSLGPLVATQEGIRYSAMITIKSNAIMMAIIALLATMSTFTAARALRFFRISEKMVNIIFFTYRYLHVIYLEYQRMMKTIKIRGFRPGNNWHTYKTYAHLVGMLLVRSYDRTERVRAAMICRGFNGRFYDLMEFRGRASDLIILVLALLAVLSIGLLQWTRIIY
ncbi:cobalt ECF transporter T component CbiQ [Thermodesulfobacteriota bacterium]